MVTQACGPPKGPLGASHTEEPMVEERVIASWQYKKGVLDGKTASLCYLVANLAVGNTV